MLIGRIAHLYPPEGPWREAEAIIDEAKERAERRIEELTRAIELDEALQAIAARPSSAEPVANAEQASPQPSNPGKSAGEGGSLTSLEETDRRPSPSTTIPVKRFVKAAKAVDKLAGLVKEVGDPSLKSIPPWKLAALISHLSRGGNRRALPIDDPLAPTLLRMGLARRSGGEVIIQRQITSLIEQVIRRGGSEAVELMEAVSRSTCPKCLAILDVGGVCPLCGGRWRE